MDKDFFNHFKIIKDITESLDAEGNEIDIIKDLVASPDLNEPIDLDDLFKNLTEEERKLLNIIQKNYDIKQSELADIFKVTQQRISKIYDSIRSKKK